MTPSEAFQATLTRSDRSTLRGKIIYPLTATTTPTVVAPISPASAFFGARANAYSALFTRYKCNFLRIRFLGDATSLVALSVLGVLDDSSTAEGDAPTTVNAVAELRCSGTTFAGQTIPKEFSYSPVSKDWFYCTPGSSGSEVRLVISGLIYSAATASSGIAMEVDYSFTFKGASDLGAQ
jgi:hypothetical protein